MAKIEDIFSALDCGESAKKGKVQTKAKPVLSETARKNKESEIYLAGVTYMGLRRANAENDTKIAELRSELLEYVDSEGVDISDKRKEVNMGHLKISVTYREGSRFNDEVAEKILKKKQLYDKAVVQVIDPEKVMELYRQKLLTKEDIEKFVTLNRTPSLHVDMDKEGDKDAKG